MHKLRGHFGDPIQRIIARRESWKLKQGQRRVRSYILDFKLLAGNAGWNDLALIDLGLAEDL